MSPATSAKARILVVEDNPADVDLLRRAFAHAGLDCDLTVIDDGEEALAFIHQSGVYAGAPAPDLAIVDVNLPKHDGLEIVQEMRASPLYRGTPVMILTSSSLPRDRARAEKLAAGRYVIKAADLDEFLRIGGTVKEMLEEGRKRR